LELNLRIQSRPYLRACQDGAHAGENGRNVGYKRAHVLEPHTYLHAAAGMLRTPADHKIWRLAAFSGMERRGSF
jgi:hypothetical protein